MKDLLKNGVLIVFAIGIGYLIFLRECKPKVKTVMQYDTIVGPERVVHDTAYIIVKEPVYITKYLKPDTVYMGLKKFNLYNDSIWNDSIHFRQSLTVDGEIVRWTQYYEPLHYFRYVETERPVYITKDLVKRELYLTGILAGNMNAFSPGVSLDYINRKRNVYGLQVQYMDGFVIGFRVGIKIR